MTEREKGLNGELYNPNYDEEIIRLREKMQDLCFQYNNILPSKIDERKLLIKKMVNNIGDNFLLEQPIYFDYGNISIGERFYSNHGLTILDGAMVSFGDDVFIGPNCQFYTASHPIDYKLRNKGLETASKITIGNNVWFGGGVIVLGGVTIGDDVVIGAGSVVTKDIPSHCVAVGNPCKVIKRIKEDNYYEEN